MSPHANVSISVEAFVHHLHDLLIEINKQLEALYKLQPDWHKRNFEFNFGDYVILQAYSADPFEILKHVGSNICDIDLLSHFGHHFILIVKDFVVYKGYFKSLMIIFHLHMGIPTLNLLLYLLQYRLSQHI
ncbi:Hypothetical predicted protein [Olea europaea subsp. europaea]|uniref:Uncharacterized protein n=1 Tax=Olea europaea subsp. europaea TaxID=158383 RepID=A0A8S0QXX8_OLEEU|nr:Hypothetical predicted protein [Olea europaea subsp. europaea]